METQVAAGYATIWLINGLFSKISVGMKTYSLPASNLQTNLKIAGRLLTRAVAQVESFAETGKPFGVIDAKNAYDAVRLLGFDDLSVRLHDVLRDLTFADEWHGAYTNIKVSPERLAEKLAFKSMEEVEAYFPPFTAEYVAYVLNRYGKHLYACNTFDFDQALLHAPEELDKVEVAHAAVMLGEFDLGSRIIGKFPGRRFDFNVVLCIELCRWGRHIEAGLLIAKLMEKEDVGIANQLALGIAGRVAWQVYPFPDY